MLQGPTALQCKVRIQRAENMLRGWLNGSALAQHGFDPSTSNKGAERTEQSKLTVTLQFCKNTTEDIPSQVRLIVFISIGFSTIYSHGQSRSKTLSPSASPHSALLYKSSSYKMHLLLYFYNIIILVYNAYIGEGAGAWHGTHGEV